MVMMMAITPSLKASSRPFPMRKRITNNEEQITKNEERKTKNE
jgi:hypothetical protein